MKKTLLYLVILAILGFGVWFFLFSKKTGDIFSSSDAQFTFQDTANIGKIFLAANDEQTSITLVRTDSGWMVNGKYHALQSNVNQLLTTMHNQQTLNPVTDQIREGIIRSFVANGIKTEVYDRKGNRIRCFFVGGEMNAFAGTAMLMEGSETPYVVQIPGFEGYLTTRYTTDLTLWRDRKIFTIDPQDIEQVSIRYAQEPLNSFTLIQKDGKVSVTLDSALHNDKPLNENRTKSYLTFFHHVYAEGIASLYKLDSLIMVMPQKAVIDVHGKNGYHQSLTVIYYPLNRKSKNLDKAPTSYDEHFNTDRYFGILNNGLDTVTVQVPTLDRIFRRGYEFFIPDETVPELPYQSPATKPTSQN